MDEFIEITEDHQKQLRWIYQKMRDNPSSGPGEGIGIVPAKLWGHDVAVVTYAKRHGEDLLAVPLAVLTNEDMMVGKGMLFPGNPEVEPIPQADD